MKQRTIRPSFQNVVCPNCKISFYPKYDGKGKFQKYCSKSCSVSAQHKRGEIGYELRGEKSINWSGNKVGYTGIHTWLVKTFGKAIHCENIHCLKNSKRFEWAKLQKKQYKRKKENFKQLCKSCHLIYDRYHSRQIQFI